MTYVRRDITLLPHSIEDEKVVIGCLLRDNEAWNEVCEFISERDFYRDDHRCIFRHIAALMEEDVPANVVTVFESIRQSNEVNQTGGESYLNEIANAIHAVANIRYYALIIREQSMLRSLIGACDEIARIALNGGGRDCGQILDEAESRIFQIVEAYPRSRRKLETLSDALNGAMEQIKKLDGYGTQHGVTGVATGYTDLDNITSGLQRGTVTVIAAGQIMDRLSLAMNIAEHIGVDLGLPVLIFSLDISAQELALRFLSSRARIDLARLRSAHLTEEDQAKLIGGLEQLHHARVCINENCRITFPELRAQARRSHRKCKGLGLIVIEDIQMIPSSQNMANRANEPGTISDRLKDLARELDVAIIVLSQLPRKVDERTDKRPLMSDLREFGGIEQDADLVILLYRDESYAMARSKNPDVTEVYIGKHRNGMTGELRLVFHEGYCRFENLVRPESS
jgi:replicative DNA helicase